jgi:glutamate synthase (NADPH/NADH) small chain
MYRRTESEMPGRFEERLYAREEGVEFLFEAAPIALRGDAAGKVRSIVCKRLRAGTGRTRLEFVPRSEFVLEADAVVIAAGYSGDNLLSRRTLGIHSNERGLTIVNEGTLETGRRGVFAGGDNVHGADLIVTAVAAGQRAAASIDKYLASLSLIPQR